MLTGRLKKGLAPFFRYTQEDCDLSHVGLDGLENRQISELSGGEFQRMLIARALAVSQKLLLLDEPAASVDVASWDQIFTLLAELNKSMTIVLVTHDLLAVSSEYQFLQNAFLSGILASIVCGMIEVIVIKKTVVMSGGIAHTAYGGVGLGYLMGFEPMVGTFLFSICTAIGIGCILSSDVIIGLFWSPGMAMGLSAR